VTASIYTTGAYAHRHPTWHAEDGEWKATQVLKMLARHRLSLGYVCEVGCGAGEILRQLQLRLPPQVEFTGFDISPYAIELANKGQTERMEFHCADFLSALTRRFDLLLCLDVFEHVEDYMGFLRRLRGRASHTVFHIPLDLSVQTVLRATPLTAVRRSVGHLHYFTKETALAALNDAGFRVEDFFYTPNNVDRPKSVLARWAKTPRQLAAAINRDLAVRILGGYSLLVLAE
jgi:SAM-dependent methyltransferase